MCEHEPLPGFDDHAPHDRYCDLILTGGVTSAIAYPAAIFALAMAYRFNSIGGSSSGAGTAALAAAAEYRRRHGSSDGFRLLLDRTAALADYDEEQTGLGWLFQPAPQNQRLFDALVPGIATPNDKPKELKGGLLREYSKSPLVVGVAYTGSIALALTLVHAWQGHIAYAWAFVAGVFLLIGAIAAPVLLVWCDVVRVVNADYGLCSGTNQLPDAPQPPLTDWLHALIQKVAGRREGEAPLTFADLADAPGSPRDTLGDHSPAGAVSINLQMFTANVTHGRPYVLPQAEADPDPPLFFCESEMRLLFPDDVVDHMMVDPITKQPNRYTGAATMATSPQPTLSLAGRFCSLWTSEPLSSTEQDEPLWGLPTKHLPIVVASRMSVSFPVLFRAVPLWVLDDEVQPPVFRRCLFADGGLCSNFPIHLFDSPVPAWPTFGISLYKLNEDPIGDELGVVTLPKDHLQGRQDRQNDFDTRPRTSARLLGFVGAMFSTIIDWNDATLVRLPGVRDRVARIGLYRGIGGLNIRMTGRQIRGLARLGGDAALLLLERFSKASSPGGTAVGWNEHRWVRFNVLRECLSNSLAGLTVSATQARYAKPLGEQIHDAIDAAPLTRVDDSGPVEDASSKLLAAQAAALDGVLAALMQAERALTAATIDQPYKPSPQPVLRVRPPL